MAKQALTVEVLGKALADEMQKMVSSAGISGRALSVEVGISRARFAQILNGERPPTVDELDRFAEWFATKASVVLRRAEEVLAPLAEVRDLSELRARVESGQARDAAALEPGYQPDREQEPESP